MMPDTNVFTERKKIWVEWAEPLSLAKKPAPKPAGLKISIKPMTKAQVAKAKAAAGKKGCK